MGEKRAQHLDRLRRRSRRDGGPRRALRAVLTAYAKCGQLESALALLQRCKEEALQQHHQQQGPLEGGELPTAEDGLRHLQLVIRDDTL